MEINTTDFNVKKEILFNGTIKYICTPKERKCDNDRCNKQIVAKSEFSLYQFCTILGKIHDDIIFGDCSDGIEPMDEPDLWADFQIALNTLETAELQLKKVARAMTINNK